MNCLYVTDDFSKRDAALTEEAELLTKQTTSIKANIKLVIAGLRELQSISVQESRPPLRDIFAWTNTEPK